MIRFQCSTCGRKYRTKFDNAHQSFLCEACRTSQFVPLPNLHSPTSAKLQAIIESIHGTRESTYHTFVDLAREALGELPYSLGDMESIFRTRDAKLSANRDRASMEGSWDTFPYVEWVCIEDGRERKSHREMLTWGMNGTAIYFHQDPILKELWPPAGYNCRCYLQPRMIEEAAERGVKHAQSWLAEGFPPPTFPANLPPYPIKLPKKWAERLKLERRIERMNS